MAAKRSKAKAKQPPHDGLVGTPSHYKENPNSQHLDRPRSERPYEKTTCTSTGLDTSAMGDQARGMDFSGVWLLKGKYSDDRRNRRARY